jgi:hypothetical protein
MRFSRIGLVCFAFLVTNCDQSQSFRAEEAQDSGDEIAAEMGGLELTPAQCNATTVAKVTASVVGSLFINAPEVLNNVRAKGVGKWSFGYAMREILELPNPGTSPTLLAAEQAKVNEFVGKFIQTAKVNTFTPSNRPGTRSQILGLWGKTRGSDSKDYLTFDKAPFHLVAIVNRLDIVKKGKTGVTAGEGRFVYGFNGGPMTVILEYDLAIGTASNKGIANINAWTKKWQALKTFLADTNTAVAGVQPNQSSTAVLKFSSAANQAAYLAALEGITELWANRTAQKRTGGTQAAISQIRTNEILTSPWELREIIRDRDAAGKARFTLTTVKNNPDQSFSGGGKGLAAWINANVVCKVASNKNTCSFNTANGEMPASIPGASAPVPLLGAAAPESFVWFQSSTKVKERFVALNTCSGCHTDETGTRFTHVDPTSGFASTFMTATDLPRRLSNFKNLVCLAAATTGELNLDEQDLSEFRMDTSSFTH